MCVVSVYVLSGVFVFVGVCVCVSVIESICVSVLFGVSW